MSRMASCLCNSTLIFPSYDDQLYVAETHFLSTKLISTKLIQIIIFKYFFESNDFEDLLYKTCMVEFIG